MGANLWDQKWLPTLLTGVAIAIIAAGVLAALRFLSIRLWNYLMNLIEAQIAVGESAHDQPLHEIERGVLDLERGGGNGPTEDGNSVTESELELGTRNSGIEHFSNQEAAHPPVIQSHGTTPQAAQVARDAAGGALVPAEMVVLPHSQQQEGSPLPSRNVASSVANAIPSMDDPTFISSFVSIFEG